jgi:Tfp pilus assembly protein PilF
VKLNWQRSLAIVLVGCGGLAGCKTPSSGLAFWKGSDSSVASSTPDVGSQKYGSLAQEFGGAPTSGKGLGGTIQPANEGVLESSWNKTTSAIASAFTYKPKVETDDPTSLNAKPVKVGAAVYVSAGRLLEDQGKLAEAQVQYERAIESEPNDLVALVSLARLHDRRGQKPQALQAYHRAAKAHPGNGLVHNDVGLFFARQEQWQPAADSLAKAIALQPANAKYRNNLATILVELNKPQEALAQLAAVHPEAAAHFNLASLLKNKGQTDLAARHLQQCLDLDPSMGDAREMLAQLGINPVAPTYTAQAPVQPVSTPVDRSQPLYRPLPDASTPEESGGSYHIGDDIGPIQPGETSKYGQTSWGTSAGPAESIELLPPIEG